jgi:hypothetical protein
MEAEMSKLSPEARSLFDAAKGGDGPTADDRTRVRAKLAARLGAGVLVGGAIGSTVAGGTAAAGAKVAGVGALALKLLATVAVVGGLGGGAYAVTRTPAAPPASLESAALSTRGAETTDRVLQDIAVANAEPDADADTDTDADVRTDTGAGADARTGAAAAAATATATGGAPASRPRSASVLPAPNSSTSTSTSSVSSAPTAAPPTAAIGAPASVAPPRSPLEEETALLGEAQAALRQGRTDVALRALDQHGQKFGAGALRDERIGTRILVLCSTGRIDEARAEAARFLRESPRSPMAARVRASCAGR